MNRYGVFWYRGHGLVMVILSTSFFSEKLSILNLWNWSLDIRVKSNMNGLDWFGWKKMIVQSISTGIDTYLPVCAFSGSDSGILQ